MFTRARGTQYLLLTLCLASAAIAEQKRDWEAGQVTFMETRFNSPDVVPPIPANQKPPQFLLYTITSETMVYTVSMKKPGKVPLAVNTTVKFAIEKGNAYVVGPDNKELQFAVIRAVPRTPAKR